MGVYFPYMILDANAHANFQGKGEHEVREYKVKKDDKEETRYDADLYKIERDFDIAIDDLTIESNSDRLDKRNKTKTNNVINAILPFDTENCVKYQANFLAGYTSERRDINIDNIEEKVEKELKDIARYSIQKEIKYYDRGVKWEEETLNIKGKQWMSAYLPVWLYSYQDSKQVLHYVAVNARTGETMGSIPMNKKKLTLITFILEILLFLLAFFVNQSTDKTIAKFLYALLITGPIYFAVKSSKYRNGSARHHYERETKNEITNLKKSDVLLQHRTNLSNSSMYGANSTKLEGEYTKVKQDEE